MPFQPFTGNICDYPSLSQYDAATDTYTGFYDVDAQGSLMWLWSAWWGNYMSIMQGATLEEVSYQYPIWANSTFAQTSPGDGWGPVGGTGQFEDDGRIVVQDLVIWLIQQSGGSVSFEDTSYSTWTVTGGSIQLPPDCINFYEHGGAHFGSFQSTKDYHPTLAWLGYMNVMGHPMTCDPNIINPPPPPPDEPQGLTGNLCDYPGIIGEDGIITYDSIYDGWSQWSTHPNFNEASYQIPDFNEDGQFGAYSDFVQLVFSLTDDLPIYCTVGPPIGPGDPTGPSDPTGPTTGLGGGRLPTGSTKSKKGRVAKENTPPPRERYEGVRENLRTTGGEYILPNGQVYVGDYHIHPTMGAMVGARHTSAPHEKLLPYTPAKAVIPPKLKDTPRSRYDRRRGRTNNNY